MSILVFRFLPDVWNRGYATECARASVEFGFGKLHLNKIIGRSHPDNRASKRVLLNVGMSYVGLEELDAGAWALYAIER